MSIRQRLRQSLWFLRIASLINKMNQKDIDSIVGRLYSGKHISTQTRREYDKICKQIIYLYKICRQSS